ncbi:COG4315 family predicted lipoprotein [Variovorax terrae]|uniref:ATP-binding protein n=1 Tax=Variovorax terrae TaxID=2923278 RepID=A0A9X1VTV7_9BURK|nr:ATP-binding protein [Variovorax terrae]MCJ0763212.1 ATP-binding protein [Variovorax terrae]
MKLLPVSLLCAALLAGCGSMSSSAPPDMPTRTADGVLIGPTGMTLYTFDRDAAGSGKSACNGGCATNWPPLTAPEAAKPIGAYTIVMRDDGRKQWAYQGWPLYYWSKDAKPGDRTGDGFNGIWKIARP